MAKGKGQTTVSRAMHRIIKTEKHEPHKERELTQMFLKNTQFLLHWWRPSYFSSY
jgi:hypothetical protein